MEHCKTKSKQEKYKKYNGEILVQVSAHRPTEILVYASCGYKLYIITDVCCILIVNKRGRKVGWYMYYNRVPTHNFDLQGMYSEYRTVVCT
jgi:hypothetical protein